MPGLAAVSSAAGGGRFTASTPILSYMGIGTSNNGKFQITNYNPSYIYTITSGSGSVSENILTVNATTGSVTITARAAKGIYQSSNITAERKAPDQYYVVTTPFQCYGCGATLPNTCCAPGPCGCGTYHTAGAFAYNGFWACCDVRAYYYNNYAGSGYTWSGSDYTNGAGEWRKIF